MNSSTPDFSNAFDVVDSQLAETEKRLNAQRRKREKKKGSERAPRNPVQQIGEAYSEKETSPPAPSAEQQPQPQQKTRKSSPVQFVARETRRNLTLKVLDENEAKFNQLFHKLQLRGDARKKQDLADEALTLLFEKYKQLG